MNNKPLRVKVYRNLHRHKAGNLEPYSVVDLSTNKVIAYAQHVVLRDATFRVQRRGRERVLKEKRKNVHAAVHGNLEHLSGVCRDGKLLKMGADGRNIRHSQTEYEKNIRKIMRWETHITSGVTDSKLFDWYFSRHVNGRSGGTWVRYNPYEYHQFVVDKKRHAVSTMDPHYSSVLDATAVFIGDDGVIVRDAVHKYLQ